MMVSAALGGGQIVLAGGSTPRTANGQFVAAVHAVGSGSVAAPRSGSATSGASAPTTSDSNYRMIERGAARRRWPTRPSRRASGSRASSGAEQAPPTTTSGGCAMPGRRSSISCCWVSGPTATPRRCFPDSLAARALAAGGRRARRQVWSRSCRGHVDRSRRCRRRDVVFLADGRLEGATRSRRRSDPTAKPDPRVPASLLVADAKQVIVLLDASAAAKVDSRAQLGHDGGHRRRPRWHQGRRRLPARPRAWRFVIEPTDGRAQSR